MAETDGSANGHFRHFSRMRFFPYLYFNGSKYTSVPCAINQLPIYLSLLELFTSFPPKTVCSSSSSSELSFEDLAPLLMHSGCIQCNNVINVSSVESGTIIYSVIGNVLNWKFGGIRNGLI